MSTYEKYMDDQFNQRLIQVNQLPKVKFGITNSDTFKSVLVKAYVVQLLDIGVSRQGQTGSKQQHSLADIGPSGGENK